MLETTNNIKHKLVSNFKVCEKTYTPDHKPMITITSRQNDVTNATDIIPL